MMELWGMWTKPSLPSLLSPLWPRVVAPEKIILMGQIQLLSIQAECKQMTFAQ